MQNEFDHNPADYEQSELEKTVHAFLTLPSKRDYDNPNVNLPDELGQFLVDKKYITAVEENDNWWYKYEDGEISCGRTPMNRAQYDAYIVQLGVRPDTGEPIWPTTNNDLAKYRFLHETGHAYQEYLSNEESGGNIPRWLGAASEHKVDSNYGILFDSCYQRRNMDKSIGLSTWGNVSNYAEDPETEVVARALEDANELVTMYLWNPGYLKIFLQYLCGELDDYGDDDLRKDRLRKITPEEKDAFFELVENYVDEIKDDVKRR
ncbi:MAG: hypothetical protein WCI57_02675 [Candidatus Berkelbacteria bacterium]